MPLLKCHSFEEMNQPVSREPGSPELIAAIRAVWDFGRRTSRVRFRPGVYRYRERRADILADHSKGALAGAWFTYWRMPGRPAPTPTRR